MERSHFSGPLVLMNFGTSQMTTSVAFTADFTRHNFNTDSSVNATMVTGNTTDATSSSVGGTETINYTWVACQ
jgi:hypothetical protein